MNSLFLIIMETGDDDVYKRAGTETVSFVEWKSIAIAVCSIATLSAVHEGFYVGTIREPK